MFGARLSNWVILCFIGIVCAIGTVDLKTENALVIYDSHFQDLTDKSSLSSPIKTLIDNLESQYKVQYHSYEDEDIKLFYEDSPRFDHLVILPSSKKVIAAKAALSQHKLIDYVNQGGNVLVVGGIEAVLPDSTRGFLNQLGIYPAPKNFQLLDHFNSNGGDEVILSDETNLVSNNRVVKSITNTNYKGGAAIISNNELLFPIIKGSPTSFTAKAGIEKVEQDTTWTFGSQGFAAVGFQALNNARLVWVGSESLITDDLINWTFQKKHVLKLQFVQHYKNDEPENPNHTLYRIKDQTIYTVGVSELSEDGKWIPFEVTNDEDQLQLSFKMLDPYQRLNLLPLGPAASIEGGSDLDTYVYYTNFTLPDHHGMFTFELDYKRVGLSFLEDKKIVTVRHLANDEFKRSWDITNSWLYIASAALVIVAWFLFVVNYIYISKTDDEKKNI
ncbi:oligosaccharyl transferase beta subunit precursor [Scheffersomyces coipomensis]|uniref:oligosaccharyl transferase beta subunit precursor n=1 Tax=Scheffersomyces coipomensis TaxID=1788519 RepID=UPI00315D0676